MTGSDINEIINNANGTVHYDLTGLEGITQAILPSDAFQSFSTKGLKIRIGFAQGTVTFGSSAVANIGKLVLGGDISVSLKAAGSLNTAQQAAAGNSAVYEISLSDNNQTITNFNAPVEVWLPYTPDPKEDTDHIVVFNIGADGVKKVMKNSGYNSANGGVTFTTTHFSAFMIG